MSERPKPEPKPEKHNPDFKWLVGDQPEQKPEQPKSPVFKPGILPNWRSWNPDLES